MKRSGPSGQGTAAIACLLLATWLAGCADSGTDPDAEGNAISGQVRLVANLFDLSGTPTGQAQVDDADEVRVVLAGAGGAPLDTTHTHHGSYTFTGLAPGAYAVSSWVLPGQPISVEGIVVGRAAEAVADTLVLGPVGDLNLSPNPSEPEGFGIEFTANGPQDFEVEVLDLALNPVWEFSGSTVGGFNHIHWNGETHERHAVPDGAYWVVVHVNGGVACNLGFWDSGGESTAGNCGHIVAAGLFVEQGGVALVSEWEGVQTGSLEVTIGEELHGLHLQFLRADSTAFAVADSCPENHMSWEIADTTVVSAVLEHDMQWTLELTGKQAGSTTITLHGWHEDHIHVSSQPIPVNVSVTAAP